MIKKKNKRIIAGVLSLALCATTAGAAAAYRGFNKVDGAADVTVISGVKADAAWSGGEIRDGYEFLSEFTVPAHTLTVGNKSAEADSVVIAGMGGTLVMKILEEGKKVLVDVKELVLQPQSELPKVRRFLMENGYVTEREEMVMEDGKYYPMMRVHFDASAVSHADSFTEEQELEFRYGKQLLTEKHPVLLAYLRWEAQIQQDILTQLSGQPATEQIAARIDDVKQILAQNARALAYYE